MSVTLGWTPNPVLIILSLGESWTTTLAPPSGSTATYPAGTAITAQLYATPATLSAGNILASWPATVTTTAATWNVPHSQTDVIPQGTLVRIRYIAPDGTGYLWASGSVIRDD